MTDSPRKQTIFRIVITGGPCAGKTTAMSWIQNAFTQKGWLVLFVDETAIQLSSGGAPWASPAPLSAHSSVLRAARSPAASSQPSPIDHYRISYKKPSDRKDFLLLITKTGS